jgi:hypothetical protein
MICPMRGACRSFDGGVGTFSGGGVVSIFLIPALGTYDLFAENCRFEKNSGFIIFY